ncbi:hypothetical protein K8B83_00385 [Shewanella inventionis]|uniref:DUF1579 domain-containing protein n=1 Tax=Shewanella inventionis TaxID=1738770 RepID=A0ABQ1IKC0_9GAMM|nr:hypothetical protein [Shewanella inventionis]MCL1156362.1 hypothetical protein [Shewanella inventionis]UAL43389.1 hypothetical protein K8B83_00385 [Shewanella inventionis]GGB44945.1 hypothetical protein GCM10011607_01240 [Shewanella inventionis]
MKRRSLLLLGALSITLSLSANADKVLLAELCPHLVGEWQGTAANPNLAPMAVTTSVMCSADQGNLYISVSRGSRFSNSETWWFRQQQDNVLLIYANGVTDDVMQHLTLYRQSGSFSFLGKGEINQRPALVQLQFDPIKATADKPKNGWQWQQSAHYLDDDSEQYQVVRALSLYPSK